MSGRTPYVVAGCPVPNGRSLELLAAQVRALGEQTRRPDALLYMTYGTPLADDPDQGTLAAIMEGVRVGFLTNRPIGETYIQRLYVGDASAAAGAEDDGARADEVQHHFNRTFLEKFPEATHLWRARFLDNLIEYDAAISSRRSIEHALSLDCALHDMRSGTMYTREWVLAPP